MNLTEAIKNRGNKIVYTFQFPIQLPDFYNPEKGLVETLRVVVSSAAEDNSGQENQKVKEVSKALRGGMNREQFENKDKELENEYFDCKLDTFDQRNAQLDAPGLGEEVKND